MSAITPTERLGAQSAYARALCTDRCVIQREDAGVVELDGFEPVRALAPLGPAVACRVGQVSAQLAARPDALPASASYRVWFPAGTDVLRRDVLTDIEVEGAPWNGPAALVVDNVILRRSSVLAEVSAAAI